MTCCVDALMDVDSCCFSVQNITAGFMMGGSTKIGRQFVTGGNSVVTAHITLGDSVVLAGRSSVTCDVPEAGAYGGHPLQPLKKR
jgi:UDP-3-O-[3-hydroxymyristoyl] glucosamine N-acyltransferase